MGTFQLILKQMRQRALGTWLTLLSVTLGVALAIVILLLGEAGRSLFVQTEFGYDVIVGTGEGSPTSLVMNTVYHIDQSPGPLPYWVYERVSTRRREPRGSKAFDMRRHVRLAVPIAVGDTYKGRPIVGTMPKFFLSLGDLEQSAEAMIDELAKIRAEALNGPSSMTPELAERESAQAKAVQQLKERMAKVDREQVPLIDAETAAGDWKYGYPATEHCTPAAAELEQAAQAIRAKKLADVKQHIDAATDLLGKISGAISNASGPLEYIPGKHYELAAGRVFYPWKFEAVIGSEVAEKAGLAMGSKFQATHGNPGPKDVVDTHPEKWEVVGIMKPTHTAADRCVYISLVSLYSIAEHEYGITGIYQAANGQTTAVPKDDDSIPKYHLEFGDALSPSLPHVKEYLDVDLPMKEWQISAILVDSRGGTMGEDLLYFFKAGGIPHAQAVNPAQVMRTFFDTFLGTSTFILLIISLLVSIVAGVGILVSIYNSVAARTREIAILRALGATRGRVLTLICAEAVVIGVVGGVAGLLVGHLLGGIASAVMNQTIGQGFDWVSIRLDELKYLLMVVVIALFSGLVPALKAYKTPVATNLVTG